jgi:chemotaxis protein methyltransferase CheR
VNDPTLTIWSSACASGEEPYSIAILLNDNFRNELRNFTVSINATDIDPKALRAAQKAEYQKTFLKNASPLQLKTYFNQTLTGNYQLKEEIKKQVAFRSLDLISSDFIRNTDLVFCRNVFIYFTRSLQDQLLMKYYHSLKVGGYLVMGKTETMWNEARHIFEEINLEARIYRKKITSDSLL